MIKLISRDIID